MQKTTRRPRNRNRNTILNTDLISTYQICNTIIEKSSKIIIGIINTLPSENTQNLTLRRRSLSNILSFYVKIYIYVNDAKRNRELLILFPLFS